MSKRKSFGRFTAMSLAGISAMSSIAIIANAEAYPTSIYEFKYNGIGTTPMFASAAALADKNDYLKSSAVVDAGVVKAFTDGFTVSADIITSIFVAENAASADLKDLGVSNTMGNGDWTYVSRDAISGLPEAIVPADYIKNRDDLSDITGNSVVFYFKTKAERDSAMSAIISSNSSKFSSVYSSAAAAISKDLTAANKALYEADLAACDEQQDVNAAEEAYQQAKAAYDKAVIVYNNTPSSDETAKEDAKTDRDDKKEAMDTAKDELDIAKGYLKAADKLLQYERDKVRAPKIKQLVNEFKSVYKSTNFDFDYTNKTADADSVFDVDDSTPQVVQTEVAGGYIQGATYTSKFGASFTNVELAYYRTTGQYNSPESYAFTGEIITDTQRKLADLDLVKIKSYLLDSDRWSQFSVLSEGGKADNDNTTEGGKKEDNKDKDTTSTTKTSWLPAAGYRTPNESNISYLGKNNYWYTSISAAEVYGGGYTGTSKTSNYNDVKGSEKIYFDALTGSYTSGDGKSSYDYLVKENEKKEDTSNSQDPYYYYYLMGGMGNTGNTTIDPDAPTIYGSSKKSGWNRILSVVKTKAAGATVTIDMNAATTIPEDIIKAAVSKDVILKAVNSNGSIVTINPDDVKYTDSINVGIKYNTGAISKSLRSKALKVNKGAVSTTQISVGEDGALCGDITATVKLSAKRAGCTVKAYRLSSNGKKLTVEAKATVKSNGSVNLKLDNGGDYLLVVID
ncbi:MAG: hypothetical protein IJF18_00285 [Oscillospiraceae bacterium]|nr:hypothetical protein [Oscillospiraceae bacterium]